MYNQRIEENMFEKEIIIPHYNILIKRSAYENFNFL